MSSFLRRRLTRLLGAAAVLVLFIFIQASQTPDTANVPVSADEPVQVFFSGSTTRGVLATVIRAVDGDTLEAKIETTGEEVRVRFLGMNTPESVDPRRPVQCFGKEASHRTKELVEGKRVLLVDDPKADDRDKYGRWLRNVVRAEDNLDVNATLVAQGYANAYLSFPLDAKRKAQIRALEQEAKTNQRGLWSPSTCEGKK